MLDNTFGLPKAETDELLSKAWELARFVYPETHDGNDAERFMENPHKATLGTENTAQELETPKTLIENYGHDGFDRVAGALLGTLKVREPKFFGS